MYTEDFQQAAKPADSALGRMKNLGVPFTPDNYTVWYEFYSGQNPELKRVIDIMMSNNQTINAERSKQIYEKFFGTGADANADVALKLEAAADRILVAIANADQNTAEYGEALQAFSGNLNTGTDGGGLKGAIAEALSATTAMQSHVRALQTRVESSATQITDLREELKLVRQDSFTDGLTGIANRKCFDEKLRQSTAEAMETGEPLSLIIADIDHFKKLNDTHGHLVGDHMLRLIAQTLHQGIKGQDTAARFGGEEFAIILPNTFFADAAALAESLRKSVGNKRLTKKGSSQDFGTVTVSMGVTAFVPGEPIPEFVRRADMALYRAKRYGRNKVVSEAPDQTQPVETG